MSGRHLSSCNLHGEPLAIIQFVDISQAIRRVYYDIPQTSGGIDPGDISCV